MSFLSKRIDRRLATYQQELIETHYREVDNMYRQIRGWRHDYRNHIQTMKAYAAQGDLEAIKTYLDALDTDLNTVDTVIKTGNAMTDAILNSKISLAKSKGIRVLADAHSCGHPKSTCAASWAIFSIMPWMPVPHCRRTSGSSGCTWT